MARNDDEDEKLFDDRAASRSSDLLVRVIGLVFCVTMLAGVVFLAVWLVTYQDSPTPTPHPQQCKQIDSC